MKHIYFSYVILIFTFLSINVNAQVGIGKNSVDGTSTIIDFNNTTDNTNGIILPAVNKAPSSLDATNNGGTLIYDLSDAKVKMFQNGTWVNLSEEGDKSKVTINSSSEIGNGVIIGSSTTQAEGALILESDDKAMILPKVNQPEVNVKSPYPGMICYDTTSKTVAIFDGKVWNYWK